MQETHVLAGGAAERLGGPQDSDSPHPERLLAEDVVSAVADAFEMMQEAVLDRSHQAGFKTAVHLLGRLAAAGIAPAPPNFDLWRVLSNSPWGLELSTVIVVPANGEDVNGGIVESVDQPVPLRQTSRPEAGETVLEGLGLARTDGGIATLHLPNEST